MVVQVAIVDACHAKKKTVRKGDEGDEGDTSC